MSSLTFQINNMCMKEVAAPIVGFCYAQRQPNRCYWAKDVLTYPFVTRRASQKRAIRSCGCLSASEFHSDRPL